MAGREAFARAKATAVHDDFGMANESSLIEIDHQIVHVVYPGSAQKVDGYLPRDNIDR
jgi:hypothetical protein